MRHFPHCVRVTMPYAIVGGATKPVRHKIAADVLRWTTKPGCQYHWSSRDERLLRPGVDPDPILSLRTYDDGVKCYAFNAVSIRTLILIRSSGQSCTNPHQMIHGS